MTMDAGHRFRKVARGRLRRTGDAVFIRVVDMSARGVERLARRLAAELSENTHDGSRRNTPYG
jgi:hypothetical protein